MVLKDVLPNVSRARAVEAGVPVTPDYAVPSRAPGLRWTACGLPRPLRRSPQGAGTLRTVNSFPLVLEQEGWVGEGRTRTGRSGGTWGGIMAHPARW